jgi:amino-acid N-acetyltransferase
MKTAHVRLRPSRPEDFESTAALLRSARLTLDGLRERFADALVAASDQEILGCVALELYGRSALLRSLAVAESARGEGLGVQLTEGALRMARERGAHDVYLLTETAQGFFPRFGFRAEERSEAPAALRESVEFRSACPGSAVMMHLELSS